MQVLCCGKVSFFGDGERCRCFSGRIPDLGELRRAEPKGGKQESNAKVSVCGVSMFGFTTVNLRFVVPI